MPFAARLPRGRFDRRYAEAFGVHDLIDPRRTRPALCAWAEEIQTELRQLVGPRRQPMRP